MVSSRLVVICSIVVCVVACQSSSEVSIGLLGHTANEVEQNPNISAKSQGLHTVHPGQTVYLSAVAGEVDIEKVEWILTPAKGSEADLVAADTLKPSFIPDKAGSYHIQLTVHPASGGVQKAECWVTAAHFVGSSYPVKTENEAQCINCHDQYVSSWSASGHATIFERGITGQLGRYDMSCAECHATGYQRDYKAPPWAKAEENQAEIIPATPAEDSFDKLKEEHPEIANLSGVQCEMCHGPGALHMGETGKHQISSSLSSEVCAYCHSFTTKTSVYSQFMSGPHVLSMDTPEEHVTMNVEGCAHCHTTQGYWHEILNKNKSAAPYDNVTGLTCATCHNPHLGKESEFMLRTGEVKTACTGCHDILVQNDIEDFSSCPQGSLLAGLGGIEFDGYEYMTGEHSTIKKNCAGCHMARNPESATADQTGGHTFRVITKGSEPVVFNSTGCTGCHEKMSLDFVRTSQDKIRKLLKELAGLLPARSDDPSLPLLPEDPKLSELQSKASYNYYTVWKDGTYGVHNPVYIKQLLDYSIRELKQAP